MGNEATATPRRPGLAEAYAARLAPRTWSWNPLVWLGVLAYRIGAGGEATPIWVIFARAPRLLLAHLVLVATSEYAISLSRRTRSLVRVFGSRVNGCMFCDDLETRMAIRHGAISQEDADALPRFATSPRFDQSERAVLRYVEELNTTGDAGETAFAELRCHYSEREIVEITWLNAVGNYLNLQAKPLGLAPRLTCAIPDAGPAAD